MAGRTVSFLRRALVAVSNAQPPIVHESMSSDDLNLLKTYVEGGYHRMGQLLEQVAVLQRENRMMLSQLNLPPSALWDQGVPPIAGAPGVDVFSQSSACRQESFEQPYYAYWAGKLAYAPRYHRKLWEFVFILQALHERGAIRPGARGLGFGVGEEPLAAYLASQGCQIVGTDMAPDDAAAAGWTDTQQHAAGKEALRRSLACPDEVFDANVSFELCDMNAIPASLDGFDFCWSACALEHLGSIEKGLTFIERSLGCLKAGGLAVHTTELNVSSNTDTVDNAGTVLFRKQDFEALAIRLAAAGHVVAPLNFDTGRGPLDQYVDLPPFRVEPHLKLAIEGYATTSFGVIVRKGR